MSAATFPNWVMLEPFVFRRDDDESFPDDSKARIRASGTTSWGAPFSVAFCFAEPPHISRLYAQLPGFPDPRKQTPLAILATHRHLALIRVGVGFRTPALELVQDFFIYSADNPCLLKALPPCTEPEMDYTRRDGRLPRRRRRDKGAPAPAKRRLMTVISMGLLCRGEQEFAVAELKLFKATHFKIYADIFLLTSASAGPADVHGGKWKSMRVSILCSDNPDDTRQLLCWETDTVIPVDHRWLCWIDYCRGILFCDVFADPIPTVYFLRFPLDEFPSTPDRSSMSWLYRGASAINDGRDLKFVNVIRNDGIGYGALKPGAGFTITCYTLAIDGMVWNKDMLGSKVWNKDCTATSDELWSHNPPERLPRGILMFPQVNIDRPYVVHFLISEFEYVMKKMWVVTIDMSTRSVESFYQYINGREGLGSEDADLIAEKSSCPLPFLPCEFSKFLHLSRKRKDME